MPQIIVVTDEDENDIVSRIKTSGFDLTKPIAREYIITQVLEAIELAEQVEKDFVKSFIEDTKE